MIRYFEIARILPARRSFKIETTEWPVQNSGSFHEEGPGPHLAVTRITAVTVDNRANALLYAWMSPISKCKRPASLPLFPSNLRGKLRRENKCAISNLNDALTGTSFFWTDVLDSFIIFRRAAVLGTSSFEQ